MFDERDSVTRESVRSKSESVYPILEYDIGLKYRIMPDLSVKAGYHFGYWGDALTQAKVVEAQNTIDDTQALTFDGATFSLEYTF